MASKVDFDNPVVLQKVLVTLRQCKQAGNIYNAIQAIQDYLESEEGFIELDSLLKASSVMRRAAEEFNLLVCYFITQLIISQDYERVEKVLSLLVNVYQGHHKASILLNLGCYKDIVGQEFDAFSHFNQSLKILNNTDDPVSLGIAHNNKAVIELKCKQFSEAFKSSRNAVMLVEPLVFAKLKEEDESRLQHNSEFLQHLQVLLISYHNLGIAQMRLK